MKLALRKGPPYNATIWQRIACWVIKARLVSQYCHGGIVIDGNLYHATSSHGLHVLKDGEWTPENWDLIDIDTDKELALHMWLRWAGAKYDWFSLLAFVGLTARDSSRMYCFEWCWLAITGEAPTFRVTPELLAMHALGNRVIRLSRSLDT